MLWNADEAKRRDENAKFAQRDGPFLPFSAIFVSEEVNKLGELKKIFFLKNVVDKRFIGHLAQKHYKHFSCG